MFGFFLVVVVARVAFAGVACNTSRVNDAAFDCEEIYGDLWLDAACSNVSRIAGVLALVTGRIDLINVVDGVVWSQLSSARHISIVRNETQQPSASSVVASFDVLDHCESLTVVNALASEVRHTKQVSNSFDSNLSNKQRKLSPNNAHIQNR